MALQHHVPDLELAGGMPSEARENELWGILEQGAGVEKNRGTWGQGKDMSPGWRMGREAAAD